jgi:hypothetical protein
MVLASPTAITGPPTIPPRPYSVFVVPEVIADHDDPL